MKRRVRVLPPGYLVGTKGHSVLRRKTYVRKPLFEVEDFLSHTMPTSRRHELDGGYSVGTYNNATNFSNAVMDDSYDLQHHSRGRDHRLLSSMNSALHTDSPSTSPLPTSRSSKPRSSSQLQHKPRRSPRLDTGIEPFKPSKLSDSVTSSSRPFGSLKLSKISDSLRISKPSDSLKLSMPKDTLQLSRKNPKPSESLQLVKMPESPLGKGKIAGIERMSPVVEHAMSLINRQRTFGKNPELDTIATTAITVPRDLKSDFFSVSPLTNYIKNRWPGQEDLPIPVSIEEAPRRKKDLYKNPYLDSDDEDFEPSVVLKSKKGRQTGDVLKALRENRLSADYADDDEEPVKGAYAIKYVDDEDKRVVERRSKKYEIDDSPTEMAMSHLVSAAALRARAVLENLTGLLGKGGLVNVEGDIKPYGGNLTTFRLHTPFHFDGPMMIGEKPAVSVGDDSFERYVFGLQEKRKDERQKVEKDTRRMSKLTRSLTNEAPKQYTLKPIGYINENNYDSFSKAVMPFESKQPSISPSRKKVHFDEDDDEPLKKGSVNLSRELVPFAHKGIEDDDDMSLVPRRRLPVYEYTEDIPIKYTIQMRSPDGEEPERLTVLEKIRIKALLVGDDKLVDPDRPRIRKPRSRYYADKMHKMDKQENLSSLMATPTSHSITIKASNAPTKVSY